MCGIVGWVEPRGAAVDEATLRTMTQALAHRGPDGEGFHFEPGCGLGHRRLSFLDLSGGQQPLSNETGTIWVIANNEIYNYRELRRELAAAGHDLRSTGDTEVLAHLYEERGQACVDALVGMYAFAVWDRASRTLLLARDRFGVKPLYYTIDARGALRFASELRALLICEDIDRSLDLTALHGYLRDLAIPEPRTIYRTVRKLPAAHWLTWRDGEVQVHRYWTLGERDQVALEDTDAEAELEAMIVESTALTMRSDVPLGLFLSGGIDSSILGWAMSRAGVEPLRTYSVSFAEPQFDESWYSRAVAEALRSVHREVRVSKDDAMTTALQLTDALDEPFADSSAIPTSILAHEARRDVKGVLSGEGADELYGGSGWHTDEPPGTIADLAAPAAKVVFSADQRRRVLTTATADRLSEDIAALEKEMPAGLDPLHQRLYIDLCSYLPSDLLTKTDRMSMLHSLEVRVPYLNHPLAEYAWRLPARFKRRAELRKWILRHIAERCLPAPIATRAKQGFAIPMDLWMWTPGRFRDAVYDTLRSRRCRQRGLFDHSAVDAMLDQHDRLTDLHGYRLWTLFVLERWMQRSGTS